MLAVQLRDLTDIEDFARGATFFGTGGGGSADSGVAALEEQLNAHRNIGWVDVDDVDDHCFTASAFGMGSIAPKTEETYKEIKSFGLKEQRYPRRSQLLVKALGHLERYIGKKIDVLVPGEIGGGNSSTLIAAAAESGRLVIDGDYAGRAVPSIFQTGPYITQKPLMPIASVDQWDNVCFIEQASNWRMAERIGKHLSIAGFLGCGLAAFPMLGADMKQAVFRNTMTESLKVGRLIRETRKKCKDPVATVVEKLGGWVLCRGTVSEKKWWDRNGYYWGHHVFIGTGKYSSIELKVFFQNENHICWRNGELLATSPDLIITVDDQTCEPMTNTSIEKGMRLAVIGLKARSMSRSPRGIEALGPRNFGLDFDYIPIEQNM